MRVCMLSKFPPIQGALFVDYGVVGDIRRPTRQAGTLGAGMYVGGGFFPALRLDFMRLFDKYQVYNNTIVQFSFMFNY